MEAWLVIVVTAFPLVAGVAAEVDGGRLSAYVVSGMLVAWIALLLVVIIRAYRRKRAHER